MYNERHKDKIVSKTDKPFEFDRENWTNYANFKLVHDNIGGEMTESKIATECDEPVRMDGTGNGCEEKDASDFKVIHEITHPDYFMVTDELGSNISQKGNGNVGDTRIL